MQRVGFAFVVVKVVQIGVVLVVVIVVAIVVVFVVVIVVGEVVVLVFVGIVVVVAGEPFAFLFGVRRSVGEAVRWRRRELGPRGRASG